MDALDHAVVHYSEIGTKSGNRAFFERALARNVQRAVAPWGKIDVQRQTGRLAFRLAGIPVDDRREALEAAARQPGISSISPAIRAAPTMDALRDAVVRLARGHDGSFKIAARRSEKTLPFDSREMNVDFGAAVQEATGRPVDVHTPDVEYRIEVDSKRGFVHDRRLKGPGGLPVGVSGSVVALLSGGIDSPVAAYQMMLRGCRVVAVHLWNRSFSGDGVRDKVLDLGRALGRFQHGFALHLVPFDAIQREIVAAAPADLRMLLYRRAMIRVAARVRAETESLGLVLGDSVGQVASQTLQNLAAVYDAAEPPVPSPLIGTSKDATVRRAKDIGTFEISIRPAQDCCGLLVAKHPSTRASVAELRDHEALYDLDPLVDAALADRETHRL